MFIVKNISKDTNESSWLIYSRMHTTRLVLEPVVAEVSVNVRVNSISFVESANRVHVGEIQSSAGREVSQISRMDVEHKDGCLRVSPVWADVTLESTIQNIQAGMEVRFDNVGQQKR